MSKQIVMAAVLFGTMIGMMTANPTLAEENETGGIGQVIDLSNYDDDTLVKILAQVNAEVASRGIAKTAHLTAGAYKTGIDFPAGNYVLTITTPDDEMNSYEQILVKHYTDDTSDYSVAQYIDLLAGKRMTISPEEGDDVIVEADFDLTFATGVTFE